MVFARSLFRGGVHPKDHKELARGAGILDLPVGEEVVIPLSQHTGSPAVPCVKKGDHVLKGAVIGTPSGFISAMIHASVSGTVKDVDLCPHPLGKRALSVIITPGKEAEAPLPAPKAREVIDSISPKDIIDCVQKAGITGMGGASFPTHVKLSPPKGKSFDTLIINAAECEPYLTADETLLRNFSREVVLGTKLLQKASGAARCIIAIEDNKPEALKALQEARPEAEGAEVVILPTRYPQGGEKQLIQAVLGREVPSGGLPVDAQALVQNAATAFAVYEAISQDKPLYERITTVTGQGVKKPGNYRIRTGTKLKDILAFAGYEGSPSSLVIMGGPMMGIPVLDMETPVIKSTSGILVLDRVRIKKEFPCIRCGRCIEHCPLSLSPTELASAYARESADRLSSLHVLDCIECGCCSYVCPAGIPLVSYMKLGKSLVRKMPKK